MTTSTNTFSTRGARRSTLAAGLALVAAVTLTACATETAPTEPGTPVTAAESMRVVDGWVKAVDEGMTAAFGMLENTGDVEVTLVAASSSISPMIEIHEVVMNDGVMVMQQKQGGIVVAAGGTHELAPGQDHIMMMGVVEPVMPGDAVTVTLQVSDGSTLEHSFAVKEFAGADEEYVGDHGDE